MTDIKRSPKSDAWPPDERPLRVGVFATIEGAQKAVATLLSAGFTKAEITVICSDQTRERYFREFEHQEPAGTYTPATAIAGGTIGAMLGGLTVALGAAVTGGAALLATAPIAMWGGGAAGGLIGAMISRGVERELANFYDQAVVRGDLLVAVDLHHRADNRKLLAVAEKILADTGAKPVALPEG